MLCIAKIESKKLTECFRCEREIDLQAGGLYFFEILGATRKKPVCPQCGVKDNPMLGLSLMFFGEAALEFHKENPGEGEPPAIVADIQAISDTIRHNEDM